ncbi:MAG: peptidyl-prolyl cis-trans isomerase [Pyrinomonadaceae bacterium MAG19_C2-C3]|nr:peptidyl-prolyl cis-trans isomerase [Pyrinomonadaceae bacterium MAG19_C2-C3]
MSLNPSHTMSYSIFNFHGRAFLVAVALLFATHFAASSVAAQEEGEPVVIDQVVAQVNNDVVTLSQVRREMRAAIDSLVRERGMTEAQAVAEMEKRQPEVIANMINEALVLQQSKELGLDDEVEVEVNKRMVELMKQQGFKTLTELDAAMTASNVNPAEFRASARRGLATSFVINREVDGKTYVSLTPTELQAYYNSNPNRFRKPESVVLSEIFLSTVGKQEAAVQARAAELAAQARSVADFGTLAVNHSDRQGAAESKGKIGAVVVDNLDERVRGHIANVKATGVAEPLKVADGYLILRVDERTPATAPVYNENQVREALTMERSPQARLTFVKGLREQGYVKIADDFRASVEAELNKTQNATGANSAPTAATNATTPARP